jgi:hypothetical protein
MNDLGKTIAGGSAEVREGVQKETVETPFRVSTV